MYWMDTSEWHKYQLSIGADDNDDTYMNTDAEGNYSLSGAIFYIVQISRIFGFW